MKRKLKILLLAVLAVIVIWYAAGWLVYGMLKATGVAQ